MSSLPQLEPEGFVWTTSSSVTMGLEIQDKGPDVLSAKEILGDEAPRAPQGSRSFPLPGMRK